MSRTGKNWFGLAALAASACALSAPVVAQEASVRDADLAAETLSDGRTLQAISQLEAQLQANPGDPALLINLGIAQAQRGQTAEARTSFEAAMRSREVVELETADGSETDSRRLARLALAMLDRGDFRPEPTNQSRFTLAE